MRSASGGDSASPARLTVRSRGGSSDAANSAMAEGTVLSNVTSPAAGSVESARAFSARITVPPQERGAKISKTDRSKQIEVEARTPARASAGKAARAQHIRSTGARCSRATPLGRPVEPEVYIT